VSARPPSRRRWVPWALGLAAAGLAVSVYLWMGKRGDAPLVCGFLGDCISVNASPYSEVFGIPVAALGAVMYLFLAASAAVLLVARPNEALAEALTLAGFIIALAGALFSLYLTAIEAFVLRAYCIWCLISFALVSTLAVLWTRALSRETREVERG